MNPIPSLPAGRPDPVARNPVPAASPGPPLGPDEHVPTPGTLSFDDVLQALNPLQHLPVIGTIYRAATGEAVNPALRILGGAAFGGPAGMLATAVVTAIEELGRASPATRTAATGPAPHG